MSEKCNWFCMGIFLHLSKILCSDLLKENVYIISAFKLFLSTTHMSTPILCNIG